MGEVLGVKCVRGYVSMEDHLECQRNWEGPPCGISPTILDMMLYQGPEREGMEFSSSSLSACHRRTALTEQYDHYIDVASGYKMTRGTVFHKGLQFQPPPPGVVGVIRELHMQAPIEVDGEIKIFHGTVDEIVLLYQEDGTLHVKITDFKTTSEIKHDLVEPRNDNVYQINAYAWLLQQQLAWWLNARDAPDSPDFPGWNDYAKLKLTKGMELHHVDKVEVDEMSLHYMDMKHTRTFTSLGILPARGKMKGTMRGGTWHRDKPTAYEELELMPIEQFAYGRTERVIRSGIRKQILAKTLLAPPLINEPGEERAKMMCMNCPVLKECILTGKEEGYNMKVQEGYAD